MIFHIFLQFTIWSNVQIHYPDIWGSTQQLYWVNPLSDRKHKSVIWYNFVLNLLSYRHFGPIQLSSIALGLVWVEIRGGASRKSQRWMSGWALFWGQDICVSNTNHLCPTYWLLTKTDDVWFLLNGLLMVGWFITLTITTPHIHFAAQHNIKIKQCHCFCHKRGPSYVTLGATNK